MELPKGWIKTNIKTITKIFPGVGFPTKYQGVSIGQYPFYKVGDISKNVQSGNRYLEFCNNYIDDNILQKIRSNLFPKNTIVFAKIGEALKLNRRAIIKNPALVDNNAIGIKARSPINDLFLFFYLNTIKLEDYSRATTVPSVRKSDIEEIPISLPPLPEQGRIVEKIEELFSELDNGITQLKKAKQQIKTYRQAVLKAAFEGKLTNKNVKEGELPEGWKIKKVNDVCENVKVGIVIKPTNYYSKIKTEHLAFRSANVREFKVEDSNWVYFTEKGNSENNRTQLKEGDVLLVRSGYPGTSCIVTPKYAGANAIDILIATPDKNLITSKFLCAFNNSPLGKGLFSKGVQGVAQKHLNVGVYSRLLIPVPTIKEQSQIIRLIEQRFSVADKLEESINKSLLQAEAMRQSILKKAFEGKLVPQNPNDEPAEKLLEKIKTL